MTDELLKRLRAAHSTVTTQPAATPPVKTMPKRKRRPKPASVAEVLIPVKKIPPAQLRAVFDWRGATNEAQLIRSLDSAINGYRCGRMIEAAIDVSGVIQWCADTLSHVRELSKLLQNLPLLPRDPVMLMFLLEPELSELREHLPKIEKKLSRFEGQRGRGQPKKIRLADHFLIGKLEKLYCAQTGKTKGSASRIGGESQRQGEGGPFVRMVSSAFTLAGYPRSEASVIRAIQHYHRQKKA
jgi:hypothetical protein